MFNKIIMSAVAIVLFFTGADLLLGLHGTYIFNLSCTRFISQLLPYLPIGLQRASLGSDFLYATFVAWCSLAFVYVWISEESYRVATVAFYISNFLVIFALFNFCAPVESLEELKGVLAGCVFGGFSWGAVYLVYLYNKSTKVLDMN